jgi:hypothetical protein
MGVMIVLLISFLSRVLIVSSTHFLVKANSETPEIGSFFLNNTEITLFDAREWYNIGTRWNLTLHVHANSTSSVIITTYLDDGVELNEQKEPLSGNFKFQVAPNETRSEIYVSHTACNAISSFYFNASLMNVLSSASGTYHFQETHPGYNPYVDTDCAHADNITLWLETHPRGYHPETRPNQSNATISLSLFATIVVFFVISIIKDKEKCSK